MILRRETSTGSNDLNVAFRPCIIEEMLGNETNKKIIKNALDSRKVSHTQLFIGAPGCGKTTAAKIIAIGLNCERNGVSSKPCLECASCSSIINGSNIDTKEINVGQSGGKDYVDAVVRDLPMAPFNNRYKVLIFDEAHELTEAAKDLLLKPIETGYEHVYFIFCTNQPEKLKSRAKGVGDAFLGRCSTLRFNCVEDAQILALLQNVCEFEGFHYNKNVIDMLVEEAKGVPRNALVWLNQIATEGSWSIETAKEILCSLREEEDPQLLDLFKALNNGSFKEAVEIFSGIKNAQVESLRIFILSCFVGCLKRAKKVGDGRKYSSIIDVITEPIYEHGKVAEYKWINCMFKITDTIMEHGRKA